MHRRVLIAIASMALGSAAAATDESPAPERTLLLDEVRPLACEGFTPQSIGFSRDGTLVASAGVGRVVIWNVQSGEQQATIAGPDRWFMDVAFSPDGKTIAAAGTEQLVAIFDATTGRVVHALSETPKHKRPELPPGPDGPVPLTDYVAAVAFSPDGKTLASGNSDGDVVLWDTETGLKTATIAGHANTVEAIAFSSDGRWLATGSADGTARLWDATTIAASGKPVHGLRVEGEAGDTRVSVAFSPDGSRLYSATGFGRIHEWDVRSGTLLRTLRGHGGGIVALAMSPDGKRLASSSVTDETMRLWDLVSGEVIGVQRDDVVPDAPSAIAFWPSDAAILATNGRGGLVHLWRFRGGEPGVADKPIDGRPFVLRQEIGDDHVLMPPFQTFTAPLDGLITQVDLRPNFYGGDKGTFLIREGDVVDGRVLHEEAFESPSGNGMAWHAFVLPEPVPVRKGARYMWSLTGAHGLKHAKADVYPGGTAGGTADRDYCFRIHFAPLAGP